MEKEKCVICGVETNYDVNTHIDFRLHYVEGAGQLCKKCYNNTDDFEEDSYLKLPKDLVLMYSNDQELGQKVREFFYKG